MSGLERPHIPKRVASACSTPQKSYKLTPKPGESNIPMPKRNKRQSMSFLPAKGKATTTVSDPSESDYRNAGDPLLKTTNLSELRSKLKSFKHKTSTSSESDQPAQQHDPMLKTTNLSELLKNRNTSTSLSDGTTVTSSTSKSRIPFHTPRIISTTKNESLVTRLTQSESKLPKRQVINNNNNNLNTTTSSSLSSSRTSPDISANDNNSFYNGKNHTKSMDDMELLNDLMKNDIDFDDLLSNCDSNNSKGESPRNLSLSSPLPSQISKILLDNEDEINNEINTYIQKNIQLEKQNIELSVYKEKFDNLQKQINDISINKEKEEEYENILKELEEYKTKYKSSQELIGRLEQQITQQNKKILELESNKNESEGLLTYSESRINELQEELTKSQNKCKSTESEIEKVYSEIDKIQEKYQSSLDDNNKELKKHQRALKAKAVEIDIWKQKYTSLLSLYQKERIENGKEEMKTSELDEEIQNITHLTVSYLMSNKTPHEVVDEENWPDNNINNNNNTVNFNPSTKCNIITENTPPNTPPPPPPHNNNNTKTETTARTPPQPSEQQQQQQQQQESSSSTTKTENRIETTQETLTESNDKVIEETPQNLSLKTLSGNQVKSIIVNTLPTQRISIKSGTKSRLNQMTESQVINIIKQFGNPYSYKVYVNHMTNSIESVDVTFPTTSISEIVYNGLDDKGFAVKYVNEENNQVES